MAMTFHITEDDFKSESSQGTCPPKGKYIAEITDVPEPQWKPGYLPPNANEEDRRKQGKELSNQIRFRLLSIEWEHPITAFMTWQRETYDGRKSLTFLNERAKSNALLVAAFGELPYPGMTLDLNDLLGKRVNLHIEPKQNGYPEIKMITPLSAADERKIEGTAPAAPAAPAAAPEPGNPERAARSSSRRTERLLKKISETAAGKGWTDDMVAGLADDEFGMTLEQMSTDELDELLAIIEDEDAISF